MAFAYSVEYWQAAINGMNGQPLGGRSITVNETRPMEARPPRTGGFGGGGGGYGGGGRGGYCAKASEFWFGSLF